MGGCMSSIYWRWVCKNELDIFLKSSSLSKDSIIEPGSDRFKRPCYSRVGVGLGIKRRENGEGWIPHETTKGFLSEQVPGEISDLT